MDSTELLLSILSLQPQKVDSGGGNADDAILALLKGLMDNVPNLIDTAALRFKINRSKSEKENPLNVVVQQEIARYNVLLNKISVSLAQLEKGIKGLVLISPDLEAMLTSINQNVVPKAFSFAYFS